MKNLRFNRIDMKNRSIYLDGFQANRKFGEYEHDGFIKCKLVHHEYYSVVLPDQIYFKYEEKIYWLQPLFFTGCQINCSGNICDISIDISHGECLSIRFKSNDVVSWLDDGSLLYSCKIIGPRYLHNFRTGKAKIESGVPYIYLYHHTDRKAKESIVGSGEFWSSQWNIQGTKKSTNISYLYLTST